MNRGFALVLMIFCHIVDDYYLQGILAKLKQKEWWAENAPFGMYRCDWAIAMAMHSFSWSFMIMLPWAIQCRFHPSVTYFALLIANALIHAVVDDMKANRKMINLLADQTAHILQIVITWAAMMEVST